MEVLLVIIILAAVFFPMLQMLSSGLLVSSEVKGTNKAIILAQKKIEEIRNSAFSAISSEAKAIISEDPAYQRQVIVATPSTNLKNVKVIVSWSPGEGSETCITIETYVSNF